MNIEISTGTKEDKDQLMDFLKHYADWKILERRIDCFLSHNFTLLAKVEDEIIGTLQWHIKEDPHCGVAEFEEFHVLEEFRNKGVGTLLIEEGIRSVKDYLRKHDFFPRRIFAFVGERDHAKHVFEKHGFKPVSEVGNLLSNDEIDLLYSLEI